MFNLKIHNITQDEYDGYAAFSIIKNNKPNDKIYYAHYDAYMMPEPKTINNILLGDIYIDAFGEIKKIEKETPLSLANKNKYSSIVSAITKIKNLISDKIICGEIDDLPDNINIYLPHSLKNANIGDIIQVNGSLELDFDKDSKLKK